MISFIKRGLGLFVLGLLVISWLSFVCPNYAEAVPPKYDQNFTSELGDYVIKPSKFNVNSEKTLRDNIIELFYPSERWNNYIYVLIRNITLWVMVIFIVIAWASLLLNKKPEDSKQHLYSLLYIMLWWIFIYGANRLFWEVLHFNNDQFTAGAEEGIWWFTNSMIWEWSVLFVILSAIKAFAFFLAIIMVVVTWFKVIAAGDGDKWKKLVKWLINVVVALLVIKWVDFIYYLAADSGTFVKNASNFIINVAKVFWYIYWVIIIIMVIVAWYLYITDGWDWSNFKKASSVLVNILLSALVLFAFLLITYQIFAEFQKWWDALETTTEEVPPLEQTFIMPDKIYV